MKRHLPRGRWTREALAGLPWRELAEITATRTGTARKPPSGVSTNWNAPPPGRISVKDRKPDGPFRDGKMWVLSRKCDTCIFRPGNLMYLRDGQRDEMVKGCIEEHTIIPCHETDGGPRSVCRGLVDVHYDDLSAVQIADRFGILAYDDPP